MLEKRSFDVNVLEGILDGHVKTFFDKLHDVVTNVGLDVGTDGSMTECFGRYENTL